MTLRARSLAAALGVLSAILPSTQVRADVLVELFTSQGCDSCPPAEELLGRIAEREDVIALAFHVDYWDYLGWRDTFASPEHTARQAAYRDAWEAPVVYTPQVVIGGRHSVPATDRERILAAVEKADAAQPHAPIRIEDSDGMLKAHLDAVEMAQPCTVWIAQYRRSATVTVERGENAGRTLAHHNVVTSLDRIGDWDGREGETVMLPQPGPGEGVAIWLQEGEGGPVLAAADHRG